MKVVTIKVVERRELKLTKVHNHETEKRREELIKIN